MKILITGGAGFIGSHTADQFISEGHEVVIVDNLSTGNLCNINKKARFYEADITSAEIFHIFKQEKPQYVYHLAAQIDVSKSLIDPYADCITNIAGTLNLLECCKKFGVKKIIYASSAAVYGNPLYTPIDEKHPVNPISHYGTSKLGAEYYIRLYDALFKIDYTILRYGNVYGPRQATKGEGGVISIFINRLINEKSPIVYGDGKQTRDFIYVEDVAAANVNALHYGNGSTMNVGTGEAVDLLSLLAILSQTMDTGAAPIFRAPRDGDIFASSFDITTAQHELKWKPRYSLEEGMKKTVEYYQLSKDMGSNQS